MKRNILPSILVDSRRGIPPHPRSLVLRYGSVVVALLLATLLRSLLDPILGDSVPYPTYFVAIMFVAWYGGLWPSLVSAVAGALLADYFFTSPRGEVLTRGLRDIVPFGLYLGAGATIAVLGDSLTVSRRRYEASEKKYRNLVEKLQEGILSVDPDGHIVFANPYMSEILGCCVDEMLGRDLSDLMGHCAVQIWRQAIDKSEPRGREASEFEILRKDGKVVHIGLAVSLATDTNGDATGAILTVIDITQRKQAEAARRADEKRLRSLLKITQQRTESVRELLDFALDEAIAFSGSTFGYIYYYNEEKQEFTLHAWSKEVMKECAIPNAPTVYQLSSTGLWGEAVRQRKPIIVNDFHSPHPLKKGYPEGHAPLLRYMTLPVFSEGRIVAVVGVANKTTDYTDVDVSQLALMMDAIFEIAERKRMEEELARELAVNRAMSELSGALIATASNVREVTDITLHCAKLLTNSAHGFVSVIDSKSGDNVSETLTAMGGAECLLKDENQRIAFPLGPDGQYPRLWGHALNTRRSFFTNSPATHAATGGTPEGHIPLRNFLSVPAIVGDRLVGQVSLANSARDYTDQDLEVIERLTSLYAVALGRKETEDTVRMLAGKLLTAQEEERRRLAREMHDDLTQRLAVLAIEAGRLEHEQSSAGAASERLRAMKEQLIDLSGDVHGLSRQLHPSILDDLGLADALRSECARFAQRENISVHCELEQVPQGISKDVALCLYRIAQEALRNIAKHAKATQATVSLATADNGVMLSVEDAGSGFDRRRTRGQPGLGLASMEERARLIGADLSIHSEPGTGTLVEVWAPLSEERS